MLELEDNEAAFSLSHVRFFEKSHEIFLLVGTVKDMTLHPRKHNGNTAHIYNAHMLGPCVCVRVCL